MTTEEITQENQDQDPQELLQRMEETARVRVSQD